MTNMVSVRRGRCVAHQRYARDVNDLELGPLHFGIIGAGRLGLATGAALQRAGFDVAHVAAPSTEGRERATRVLNVTAHEDPLAACEQVDCVVLCVPDDELAALVAHLATRPSDASPRRLRFVSTSAIGGTAALTPLAAAGHDICVIHPVASFTELDGSTAPFTGAAAAIGSIDDATATFAHALAHALDLVPFQIDEDGWPAHAAACTAAAGYVGLALSLANELSFAAHIHEGAARGAYGRLAVQAAERFQASGATTSSGAITRGDAASLQLQIRAVRQHASGFEELVDAATSASINAAFTSGGIDIDTARALAAAAGAAFHESLPDRGSST
jgi:predicted short-subunit dehydrogenase-like oxidoreductase (DUF2520 family)